MRHIFLADAASVCKSALWERIQGWEVVMAVMVICITWAVVQVGRMYYMWRVSQTNTCRHTTGDD